MKKIILLPLLITHFSLLTTFSVSAVLVPCGGPGQEPCQFCDLAELIGRVINFGIKLVIPIGVVFIAWGGIEILAASGSTEKAKKGRDILTAAVIGIVIALTAWLLLSVFLQILTGQSFSPWKLGSASFC
jgi:hypothetical protein